MEHPRREDSGPATSRRTYLTGAGTALAAAAVAGCLGRSDSSDPTVLPEPDRQVDSDDLPYPAYGQRLPEVELPVALREGRVTTTGFEVPRLVTFVYTHCMTACPVLTQALVRAQDRAAEEGYGDGVAFLEVTFDPERDTPERLREYAGERSVDLGADNWYFLRPPTGARARAVVDGEFGVAYKRTTPESTDRYMFTHSTLVLLVNGDDYVERAYRDGETALRAVPEDLERVARA